MKKFTLPLLAALSLILFGACGRTNTSDKTADGKEKLSIVTTFYPMYDFTKNIVGDEGDVKLLIPAGSEPHDYEPSAKDMATIHDADVFVYHNENMESWVPKAAKGWKKEPRTSLKVPKTWSYFLAVTKTDTTMTTNMAKKATTMN